MKPEPADARIAPCAELRNDLPAREFHATTADCFAGNVYFYACDAGFVEKIPGKTEK